VNIINRMQQLPTPIGLVPLFVVEINNNPTSFLEQEMATEFSNLFKRLDDKEKSEAFLKQAGKLK
jgi:hypothetical protein